MIKTYLFILIQERQLNNNFDIIITKTIDK